MCVHGLRLEISQKWLKSDPLRLNFSKIREVRLWEILSDWLQQLSDGCGWPPADVVTPWSDWGDFSRKLASLSLGPMVDHGTGCSQSDWQLLAATWLPAPHWVLGGKA